ncbi:hypothetical protein OH76DRAFT_1561263 [Lentinus brumalis]|uniref:Uncharacterized protein n=1 Tax=Lentinus brumalis TaxID=2498619 RepID=A0A371CNU6_9APHY|nr:hypothetical protein OH76DRAFT_1561263 [Polyporus brumalis]
MPADRRKYIPSPLSQSIVGRRYRRTAFGQLADDGHDTGPKPSPFLTNMFSDSRMWSNSVYKPARDEEPLRNDAQPCPLTGKNWLQPHHLPSIEPIARRLREVDIELYGHSTAYVPCGIKGCPYCSESVTKPDTEPPVEDFVFDVRAFPDYTPGRVADMPKSFRPVPDINAKGASSRRINFSPYLCKDYTTALNTRPNKENTSPHPYDQLMHRRKRYWKRTSPRTEDAALVVDPDMMQASEPTISAYEDIQRCCDVPSPAFKTREPEDDDL